jgi:cytochrome c-type biogenesis protein CcmH
VQNANPARAIQSWKKLVPLLADNPEQQAQLRDLITETETNPQLVGTQDQSQPDANASSDNSAAALSAADDDSTGIEVAVSIDPSIAAELEKTASPSTAVFVLARATNGPPAPLAVKRLTLADLPTTVTLSDSDAMMAQLSLSKFAEVSVLARVSISGNPIAQSGDFQSQATDIVQTPDSMQSLAVKIDTKVE